MKIRCKSITYAMKAKEILQNSGISAAVEKDLRLSGGGCVYAVSFADRYRQAALPLLKSGGILLHATVNWADYE